MINKQKKERNKLIKVLIAVAILALTAIIIIYIPHDRIQYIVKSSGNLAPVVYIVLFAILPIFFFPVPVLALAAGMAFGLWSGTLYTIIGAFINCSLMFFIARYLGKDSIDRMVQDKLSDNIKAKIYGSDSNLGLFILILRLIPVVPYNIINYVSGLSNISYRKYIFYSILGVIPGTIVFLNVGDKASQLNSLGFWISIALLIALIVASSLLAKKLQNKGKI